MPGLFPDGVGEAMATSAGGVPVPREEPDPRPDAGDVAAELAHLRAGRERLLRVIGVADPDDVIGLVATLALRALGPAVADRWGSDDGPETASEGTEGTGAQDPATTPVPAPAEDWAIAREWAADRFR